MSEWKEYKLGEIAVVKGGKRLPKGELLVDYETPHPYIRVTDIVNKWIHKKGLMYVTSEIQKTISRYTVNYGDVILSIVGSIGFVARIGYDIDGANLTENCVKIVTNKDVIDDDYLYYYLKSSIGQEEINKRNVGAVQPKLPIYNINDIIITLPSLEIQHSIASILSSLDDKIDLLYRENATLEAMAETLFRQWFVVEAKEEWEEKPLKEVVDIAIGRTPPRKESKWFSTNPNDIKWLSIKDMGGDSVFLFNTSEYLTKEAVEVFSIPIIPKSTVVLSFKMTVGRVGITTEDMLSNEAIAHFKFKDDTPFSKEYLYLFLRNYRYDTLGTTSSIVTAINSAMIKNLKIAVPDADIMERFKNQAQPIFDKIYSNQEQINTLVQTRDGLLPRLMSNEIAL